MRMHAAAGRPGPASDCMLRRWQEDRLGSGGLRKEDFAASIAKNVLLRGQFPLVRVLSKWTQLRVGAAVLPRAALSVSKLFALYSLCDL